MNNTKRPCLIFIDDEAFDRYWIDPDKPLILGRNEINLDEEKRISRHQIEVKFDDDKLVLRQMGVNPSSITNRGSKEKTVTKKDFIYPLKDGDIISLLCTKHEEKGKFRLQFPEPEDNSQPNTTDFEQTLAVTDLDILIDCMDSNSASQSRKNSSTLSTYMQNDVKTNATKNNTNSDKNTIVNNTNVITHEHDQDNSVDKTIDSDSQKNKHDESNNTNVMPIEQSNSNEKNINDDNAVPNNNSNGNENKTELMAVEDIKTNGRKRKAPSKRQHRKKIEDDSHHGHNNAHDGGGSDEGSDTNEYSDGEGSPDTRHRRKRQRIDRLAENLKNLNEKAEHELDAKNNSNDEDTAINSNKPKDFSKEIESVQLLMPGAAKEDVLKALISSHGSIDVAIQRLLEDSIASKNELAKTSENIPNDEQQADNIVAPINKTDSDLARELQREFEAEEELSKKKIEEEDQRLAEQLWQEEQAAKKKVEQRAERKADQDKQEKKDEQAPPIAANHNQFQHEDKNEKKIESAPVVHDKKIITEQVKFPSYWSDQDDDVQVFNLDPNSDEYQSVCDRFMSTMAVNTQITVQKIERNQNKRLWKWYYLKRDEIAKVNNNNAKETYLFHGTAQNNVATITKDGLDFRVANLNGAIGAGIYFAEQSSVSLGYVSTNAGVTPRMFLCRVALGSVTNGYNGLRVPPTIPGTDRMHDSVSSTLINGINKIYCIFDNHQSYPEYIIYYAYKYQPFAF